MAMTMIPAGNVRVRLLRATEYARELLPPDTLAVVDEATAARWIRAKLAIAEPVVPTKVTQTTCPKCGAAMEYPATPAPDQRWNQCRNPRCGHGWLR